jgi:peptidoglycan hydrolase-like protein with peptidoglycan-binding domain
MTYTTKILKGAIRFIIQASVLAVAVLIVSAPHTTHAATIERTLKLGARGADVTAMQTFLASDPTLYPQGLITGYFGSLTKSAVSNFQARNALTTDGIVGPITRSFLNVQMAGGMASSTSAPVISNAMVNVNQINATVSWTTNENAKGIVYYSASPLVTYERENSVDVSGATAMTDTMFHTGQSISIQGLQANTTYYYMIYTTDEAGNVSVTWPSTFRTLN